MKPFVVQKTGVVEEDEYDELLQKMENEIYQSTFKGVWNYQSTWAQKIARA